LALGGRSGILCQRSTLEEYAYGTGACGIFVVSRGGVGIAAGPPDEACVIAGAIAFEGGKIAGRFMGKIGIEDCNEAAVPS